jgi:ABC-type amino acid transport substrate-binding protein
MIKSCAPNKITVVALVLAVAVLGMAVLQLPHGDGSTAKKETAFERVMKTQTLRCSYISRAHHFTIDSAAKQMSGIDYEVMEAIGKLLHLNIVWSEETGVGAFPELLSSGKADAHCVTMWTNVARATRVIATGPVLYTPVYAYVRADDTRYDNHIEALNDENSIISVADSGTMKAIADASFPKAKQFALTGLSTEAELLMNVATHKADATFADELAVHDYNKNNPDKQLKRVVGVPALRTYSEAFDVAMGEWELRELLSAALNELHNNGTIDRILSKYENMPGELLRVIMPYAVGQKS